MEIIDRFLVGRDVRLFKEGTKSVEALFTRLPEAKDLAVKVLHHSDPQVSEESRRVVTQEEVEKAFLLNELRGVLDMKRRNFLLHPRRVIFNDEMNMKAEFDIWDDRKIKVSQNNIRRVPTGRNLRFDIVSVDDTWEYEQVYGERFLQKGKIIRESVKFSLNQIDRVEPNAPFYDTATLIKERNKLQVQIPVGRDNSKIMYTEVRRDKLTKPKITSRR